MTFFPFNAYAAEFAAGRAGGDVMTSSRHNGRPLTAGGSYAGRSS